MASGTTVDAARDIGQVVAVNVDTGTGTQSFRIPEPIALTAFMINRVEQLRGVQRLLKRRLDDKKLGPILVVLTGDVADFHEGFAQRYERLEARKRIDMVPGIAPLIPLRVLHWPRRRVSMEELLLSFAGPIATLADGDEVEDVMRELRELPESISFRHIFKAEYWDEKHEQLIRDWLKFIESEWPEPRNSSVAIGFLCIQTDDKVEKKSASMRRVLNDLKQEYADSERVYFASELEMIEQIDMEEWEPIASERLGADFHSGLLLEIREHLFAQQDKYHYGALYSALMTILQERFFGAVKPQFMEDR